MDADKFIKSVGPLLKEQGFKKASATWRKDQGESVAVFNIQKSQWGGGACYVNLGVYFRDLGDDSSPTENKCHVRVRLRVGKPSAVVAAAIQWFAARASLQDARQLAKADSKRGLVLKELLDESRA
jgi:hypothetical protein